MLNVHTTCIMVKNKSYDLCDLFVFFLSLFNLNFALLFVFIESTTATPSFIFFYLYGSMNT